MAWILKRGAAAFVLLALALQFGCSGDDAEDDTSPAQGDDDSSPVEDTPPVGTPTPSILTLEITHPAEDGRLVGYQTRLAGTCSVAGATVVLDGDVEGLALCSEDQSWEVVLDFTGVALGEVTVEAYLTADEAASEPVYRTLVKDNTDCDTPAQRDDVFANYDDGADGAETPYHICTATQLSHLASFPDANYLVRNDIDLKETPFSLSTITYTGTFDGGGFAIENLVIDAPFSDEVGLFRYVDAGTIQNLAIENATVLGRNQVGVVAGRLRNDATVENVTVAGQVEGTNNVGGIAGYVDDVVEGVTLTHVTVSGTVDGESNTGGLIGGSRDNWAYPITVSGCQISGEVSATTGQVGGVLGNAHVSETVTIADTEVVADVSSPEGGFVGGLVGRGQLLSVTNTSFTGSITTGLEANDVYAGGLVGYAGEGSVIEDSWADADVASHGGSTGGLAGRFYGAAIRRSHHTGNVTARASADAEAQARNVGGLIGSTSGAGDLELSSVYHEGDVIVTGDLQSNTVGGLVGYLRGDSFDIRQSYSSGDVIDDTPEAANVGGFIGYLEQNGADGESTIADCYAEGAVRGTDAHQAGGFLGAGALSLSSLTVRTCTFSGDVEAGGTGDNVGGFFGYLVLNSADDPGVRLTIEDCSVDGTLVTSAANSVGGFAGNLYNRNHSNTTIARVSASNTVTLDPLSTNQVGGLFGRLAGGDDATVTLSTLRAAVDLEGGEDNFGGLFGVLAMGSRSTITIDDAQADGSVHAAGQSLGGFIGYLGVGSGGALEISASLATGDVTGDDPATGENYVGGFVGYARISGDATVLLDDVAALGTVRADNYSNVGGLIGYYSVDKSSSATSNTIQDAHAEGTVRSYGDSVGGLIGGIYTRGGVTLSVSNTHASGLVSGNSSVGGLIGYIRASDDGAVNLSSTYADGPVTSQESYSGGLIGYMRMDDSARADLYRCHATGDVDVSSGDYHGGLVGATAARVSIEQSYATGDVDGPGRYVGGLIGGSGSANQSIIGSFATGTVSTNNENGSVGGLAGIFRGEIFTSFATGDVSGKNDVGGLVGYFYTADGSPPIDDCYYTGTVTRAEGATEDASRFGHIFGRWTTDEDLGESLYYNADYPIVDGHTGTELEDPNDSGTGLTGSEMTNPTSFVGFDFDDTDDTDWVMPSSDFALPGQTTSYAYPILRWME